MTTSMLEKKMQYAIASSNQTHEIKRFRWCVVDRSIMKCIPKTNLDDQTNPNLQQTDTPYMELPSNDS